LNVAHRRNVAARPKPMLAERRAPGYNPLYGICGRLQPTLLKCHRPLEPYQVRQSIPFLPKWAAAA